MNKAIINTDTHSLPALESHPKAERTLPSRKQNKAGTTSYSISLKALKAKQKNALQGQKLLKICNELSAEQDPAQLL